MPASYETHRKQLELILQAWGMPEPTAASTAEIMSWADLHGIDTHGISMVPPYDERRRDSKLDMRAEPKVVKETPVSVLIDGGGGLGHPNARRGMELAIEKAKKTGIGVAAVRNSGHFGACGFYALMAVESGLIGMVTTSASGIQVVADQRRPGAARHRSDRLRRTRQARRAVPARHGDHDGGRRQDPQQGQREPAGADRAGWSPRTASPAPIRCEVSKGGFMTPLGGTPEGSSHKGYGLGAMVNILTLGPVGRPMVTDPMHTKKPGTMDIGHFFLALDPGMFRDVADFRADVAAFCDTLRATKPADPGQARHGRRRSRAPHRGAAPENRHPRRPQPARKGARDRARLRRALDHRQLDVSSRFCARTRACAARRRPRRRRCSARSCRSGRSRGRRRDTS